MKTWLRLTALQEFRGTIPIDEAVLDVRHLDHPLICVDLRL